MNSSQKRTKYDIYAEILEVVRRLQPCSLTRASYGAGVPVDRAKRYIASLVAAGLLAQQRGEKVNRYSVTTRGLEFVEAYWKMKEFTEVLS